MSMQERSTEFLKDSSDWERKSTSIQGVFLLKLPNSKAGTWKESISIEINPVNPSYVISKSTSTKILHNFNMLIELTSYGLEGYRLREEQLISSVRTKLTLG